jgi:hypothetical protein
LLIAFLYGAAYHFLRGGGGGHFFLYIVLSALGFGVGHLAGIWLGWDFIPLGQLRLGLSSVGSLVLLVIGDWLSRVEARPESKV